MGLNTSWIRVWNGFKVCRLHVPGDSCGVAAIAGDDFLGVCGKERKYVCLIRSHDCFQLGIKRKDYWRYMKHSTNILPDKIKI